MERPGRPDRAFVTTAVGLGLGLVAVASGAERVLEHADAAARLAAWGLPGAVLALAAILELAVGAALIAGVAMKPAAGVLAVEMAILAIVSGAHGDVALFGPVLVAAAAAWLALAGADVEAGSAGGPG